MSYRYSAYGISISSSIPLPELTPAPKSQEPSLRIFEADLPRGSGSHSFEGDARLANLWVEEVETAFRMIEGRELLFHSFRRQFGRNQRLYLLGSAMAAILHQRALLPLHAAVLDLGGQAVAFLGHSGAGKSTLAAWLAENDAQLLSDDVCVLRGTQNGGMMASVGIPRLRLWQDALEARGGCIDDHPRAFDDWDKYDVVQRSPAVEQDKQVPLRQIYLLEFGADKLEFEPVTGAEAVAAVSENTYRGSYIRKMGQVHRHWTQCIEIARSIPIVRLRRPRNLSRMDEVCSELLQHVRNAA